MELQLNIVRVAWLSIFFSSFIGGREVIILETVLEFIRELLKGIGREITARFFRKNVLEYKKTTPRRRSIRVVREKIKT